MRAGLFKYAPNRGGATRWFVASCDARRATRGRGELGWIGGDRVQFSAADHERVFVRGEGMGADGGRRRGGAACELCGAPAAVHCEADAAFLCAACDAKVHGANFLASRHRRRRIAGATASAVVWEEGCESGESLASTSCVSTADSASTSVAPASRRQRQPRARGRPQRRARAEAVLEGWAKRMGLGAEAAHRRAAAAGRALRACGRDVAAARVPLRVAMAAALWLEVAANGAGQADTLRRLEACAHVPARFVMAVASSMERARARKRADVDAEEGWDECS